MFDVDTFALRCCRYATLLSRETDRHTCIFVSRNVWFTFAKSCGLTPPMMWFWHLDVRGMPLLYDNGLPDGQVEIRNV